MHSILLTHHIKGQAMTRTLRTLLLSAMIFVSFIEPVASQGLPIIQAAEELAQRLRIGIDQEETVRVAVMPLAKLGGGVDNLGRYLAESITTALFDTGGVNIVERSLMDEALKEMRLGESGVIGPRTAQQVGNLLGADAIITGTVSDVGNWAEANVRMIHVRSGQLLATGKVLIIDPDVVPSESKKASSAQMPAALPVENFGQFRIAVLGVTAVRASGEVRVSLRYQNLTGQPVVLSNPGRSPCGDAFGSDGRGQAYRCVRGMGQVGNGQGITLPVGGGTNVLYIWVPIQSGARKPGELNIQIPHIVASLISRVYQGEMGAYQTTMPQVIGRQVVAFNNLPVLIQ